MTPTGMKDVVAPPTELIEADVARALAEDIGHGAIEIVLLAHEQILAERRLHPPDAVRARSV